MNLFLSLDQRKMSGKKKMILLTGGNENEVTIVGLYCYCVCDVTVWQGLYNQPSLFSSPPEDLWLRVPALMGTRVAMGLVYSPTHPTFMCVTVLQTSQRALEACMGRTSHSGVLSSLCACHMVKTEMAVQCQQGSTMGSHYSLKVLHFSPHSMCFPPLL